MDTVSPSCCFGEECAIGARRPSAAPLRVPVSTLLYGEEGYYTGTLEYARLAMGLADDRASRYGIRECSGWVLSRVLMLVLVLVLVQAPRYLFDVGAPSFTRKTT